MATSRTAYTPEQAFRVCNLYKQFPEQKTITALARELGKTEKSIRQKLVRGGLYKAPEYETKKGEKPVKKSAHAEKIGKALNLADSDIAGLARANKNVLDKLIKKLAL